MRTIHLSLTFVVLSACTGIQSQVLTPLPSGPTVLTMEMTRYRFLNVASVKPGRVIVDVRNVDTIDHQLVMVKIGENVPGTLAEQVRSDARHPAQTLQLFGVATGERRTFAVDLPVGRYGLLCFVTDPDGISHAHKGMASDLWVQPR